MYNKFFNVFYGFFSKANWILTPQVQVKFTSIWTLQSFPSLLTGSLTFTLLILYDGKFKLSQVSLNLSLTNTQDMLLTAIRWKKLEAPVSHDETIANDPNCTSDIKLLTSLNDVTDANIIDDILGNTQLVRRQKLIINYFIITFLSHNVFSLPLLEV